MKKTLVKTIAAVTAGVMMIGLVGCNDTTEPGPGPGPGDGPNNPPPTTVTAPATLYDRADYLARAVDAHYITRENDQVYGAGYYNALEGGTDGYANCYEYSSIITMANRLYAVSTDDDQKTYYKSLIDDYIGGLDYFEGSGTYTSTHGKFAWDGLYGVHRMEYAKTGDVSTDMVYDDLMWIIRDFCGVYKTTGDEKYIALAEHLTKACLDGWDSTKNGIGGIVWGPTYQSKHSCSNGPLISALCELADYYKDSDAKVTAEDTVYGEQAFGKTYVEWDNMIGMKKYDYYLHWAKEVYEFTYSYLRESDYTYADNLRHGQKVVKDAAATGGEYFYFEPYGGTNEGSKYTYNTGAMISGAAWLYRLTGDENYLVQGRLMSEGAHHYFAKTVTVGDEQMQMYDCRTTLLFNSVLMQGYLDLADASKAKNPAVNAELQKELASYVKVFKTSIDYAFENYVINRTLPHNYLQGWLYASSDGAETFDTHKDIKDATATPIILAMIVQYEKNHGTI
ncbi:MAG: hypothetical protein HDT28_01705 [Clostridiales bacterium]|nr:hypothetical protein [Clostridiales bacterium]